MLKNKVIVITGGAGLIGKEFVKAVVENNGIAVIADINENMGYRTLDIVKEELNSTMQNLQSKLNFVKLDITSKESLNSRIQMSI